MTRYFMRLDLTAAATVSPASPFLVRPPNPADNRALGQLLYDAYHGTIDDEGESPEESVGVADQLFRGDFGEMLWEKSELVWVENHCIGGTLLTFHRGTPFVAFSLTHPDYQRKGIARAGLQRAIARLQADQQTALRLLVTEGNPAEILYQSLGFVREPT